MTYAEMIYLRTLHNARGHETTVPPFEVWLHTRYAYLSANGLVAGRAELASESSSTSVMLRHGRVCIQQ